MLISIGRITILTSSSSAPHQPRLCRALLHQFPFTTIPAPHQPRLCRALLHQSPFTTAPTPQPNTTNHQDPKFLLQALKDYGFTDTQIATLSRRARWFSPSGYTDILSSKMSYLFNDSGLDPRDLAKLITSDPGVLYRSLNTSIIPSISYLSSILPNRIDLSHALARAPQMLGRAHTLVATNVQVLKAYGVPVSGISKLLVLFPRSLMHSTKRIQQVLNALLVAKFDLSKKMLIYAIHVKLSMSDSMCEMKERAYVSFGWSAEEVHLGFQKWPFMFAISEEKIRRTLDLLMNVLKITAADVLASPKLMTSSLEKTLIPRCCVLNVLMVRGLVDKDTSVLIALRKSTKSFKNLYVQKYQYDVPQVLEAYHGKMKFLGFDHMR